jgi:hypothetical protein
MTVLSSERGESAELRSDGGASVELQSDGIPERVSSRIQYVVSLQNSRLLLLFIKGCVYSCTKTRQRIRLNIGQPCGVGAWRDSLLPRIVRMISYRVGHLCEIGKRAVRVGGMWHAEWLQVQSCVIIYTLVPGCLQPSPASQT